MTGLGDEYDVEGVDEETPGAYRDAVSEEADVMGLADAHALWRDTGRDRRTERAYTAAVDYLTGLDPDQEDITRFCTDTALDGADGLFLSAVIDEAAADTVDLPGLAGVDYIGYRTEKEVHVRGDVGDRCGGWLRGGSIHVEGDAGAETGKFMRNGAITVDGDAGAYAGQGMHDGYLTVAGDATGAGGVVTDESYLGEWMSGGEITVHGDTGDRVGQRITGGYIDIRGDTGSHAGYSMTDGIIAVEGAAGEALGHSMQGGILDVGSTSHPVGTEMRAGTIHVRDRVDGVWPPIGGGARGGIFYGRRNAAEQVWPPDLLLGRAKQRNGGT